MGHHLPIGISPISTSMEAKAWTDLVGFKVETAFHTKLPAEKAVTAVTAPVIIYAAP